VASERGIPQAATEEAFARHVSQTRLVRSNYRKKEYDNVIIFEFFMPLANEAALRDSLDALFFKDIVMTRLEKVIPQNQLEKYFLAEE